MFILDRPSSEWFILFSKSFYWPGLFQEVSVVVQKDKKYDLLSREECILILIDIQDKLMPAIAEKEKIVSNAVKLVQFCRITGIPVVITEQEKLGSTVAVLKNELQGVEPFHKVHFNCFYCDDFDAEIKKTGKKTLILAGVEAHICVAQTALQAIPFYGVHAVSDATSSRLMENHKVALDRMRNAGVIITSAEMFMYEILQRAGTDEFKKVLPLVK
ncbi:MAG: hydrolase [Syntrophus sp. (in: bacteria)]|nr:hydrolase [Syntrophus sp. (in: bacteria)]